MPEGSPEDSARRVALIRDEMRLEVGVLHDRVNALISAEAFLTISYTMAMTSPRGGLFAVVAPLLSVVGLALAVLAWPGVNTGFKILVEWNALLLEALREAPAGSRPAWRPSVLAAGSRTGADHRASMLFARAVPPVFAAAWAILAAVALVAPWRR